MNDRYDMHDDVCGQEDFVGQRKAQRRGSQLPGLATRMTGLLFRGMETCPA